MLLKRLFIALYSGLLLYTLLMVSLGPSGVEAKGSLHTQAIAMETRLDELKAINQGLRDRITALKKSREEIGIHAKALGYYAEGEGILILPARVREKGYFGAGEPLLAVRGFHTAAQTCSMLASLFALAFFVVLSLRNGRAPR